MRDEIKKLENILFKALGSLLEDLLNVNYAHLHDDV